MEYVMSYKYLKGALLLMGLGVGTETYAACTLSSGFQTIKIDMAIGKVVIKPSDAVGAVIYKKQVPIPENRSSTISCNNNNPGKFVAELVGNPQFAMQPSIYKTNVPGIGIRLYRTVNGNSTFSGYYPYSRQLEVNTNYYLGAGEFIIEIVKTAASTGTGNLAQGLYSTYYLDTVPGTPLLTSSVIGDTITITSSSCEIQGSVDKIVQLPTVNKSGFTGVGSTQGTQPFDLNISCNGGKNIQTPDRISLSFDYDLATGTTNVLKNLAPDNVKAAGVGTQLISKYQGASQAIVKQGTVQLGQLTSDQQVTYNLPLEARYYQTNATVTAGEVKSMATVTIQYD